MNLVLVLRPKQPRDAEFAALDPNLRRLVDRLKRHHSAIRTRHEPSVVARLLDRSRLRLEFAIEELVERLERVEGV